MENRRNYYRILHVQPDAPPEVIRAGYRTLMQRLRMHPDLGGDSANAALINEAFEILDDPVKRAAYDRGRQRVVDERAARRRASPQRSARTAGAIEGPVVEAPSACAFCRTTHSARYATRLRATCTECGSPLHPAVKVSPDGARRAVPRKPRQMPVSYCVTWPARQLFTGATEDVSISGMRLSTAHELPVNARLRIDCEFCTAVGLVRSCRPSPGGHSTSWTIGVEFVTVSAKRPRGSFVSTEA